MSGAPGALAVLPDDWSSGFPARFSRAIEAIDAVNAADPTLLDIDGVARPEAAVHAEQMTAWVLRLAPDASEAQLLAARAHHLRRWAIPRSSEPEGRAGYLRWRRTCRRRQAEEATTLLEEAGYPPDEIAAVVRIMRKEGLGTDPEAQVHEDALCLVFVTFQFAGLARRLGDAHMVEVVRKTLRKMSDRAVAEAVALPLTPHDRAIVEAASSS